MHVGKPKVAPAVPVGQLLMVQADQMENGCPQVVDVALVFDGVIPKFVGGPVEGSSLDPSTG